MDQEQPNNPLHGVTLKAILEFLVDKHGWDVLAEQVNIRCFAYEPSIKSSLKFLRQTEWARTKVEQIYIQDVAKAERRRKQNKRRAAMRAARTEE